MIARLVTAVALAALPAAPALAQNPPPVPHISVSGTAEVRVAPDEIHLSVGVETRHDRVEEAKRQNDDRVSKALSFLIGLGLDKKDIQTDFIGIDSDYDSRDRTRPLVYIAQKSIGIKLTRIAAFEDVLTGLLAHGVTHVHGIDFRTSQLRKHRDAARAMAVQAAREKADALTSDLGVRRGKVYSISENYWGGSWNWSGSYWRSRGGGGMSQNVSQSAGGSTAEGAMAVGQISISAVVNVTFVIE